MLSASRIKKGQNIGTMFIIITSKERPSMTVKRATDTPKAELASRMDGQTERTDGWPEPQNDVN